MQRARVLWSFAVVLVMLGCTAKSPARGVVQGRVTMGSKPVTGATVFFENIDTGVAINAALDQDGRYDVKSHQGAGLPPGKYQVAVAPGGVMGADDEQVLAGDAAPATAKLPATPVPEKYHSPSSSGLTIEVKEGANPPFDFSLVPK